jgi:hypothetical protein
MLKEFASVLTVVSLICSTLFCDFASAATKEEKEAKQIAKIKQKVAQVGIGEKAIIRVDLKGVEKSIKGYLSEVKEENFTVTNSKTKETTRVAYRDVERIEKKHFPTIAKVGIVIGVVMGVLIIIVYATGLGD